MIFSAYFNYHEDSVIARIRARAVMMTNLNQETYEEPMQVNKNLYLAIWLGHRHPT